MAGQAVNRIYRIGKQTSVNCQNSLRLCRPRILAGYPLRGIRDLYVDLDDFNYVDSVNSVKKFISVLSVDSVANNRRSYRGCT
jgi:hypothetical protein